jgi:hypothetical protein
MGRWREGGNRRLAIPEASADAFRRMHSVLWFAGTIAWAAAVNQFLLSVLELDPQDDALGSDHRSGSLRSGGRGGLCVPRVDSHGLNFHHGW